MIPLIISIAFMTTCVAGMSLNAYMLYRNNKVAKFRKEILQMASEESERRINVGRNDFLVPLNIMDKHTYAQMLYSSKPLKLEAWFTEEEIKMLKGEK